MAALLSDLAASPVGSEALQYRLAQWFVQAVGMARAVLASRQVRRLHPILMPWLPDSPKVAALFVEKGGVYYGLDDVDPWDEERDARLYAGPWPVVAHPPCKAWSLMGQCRPEIVRGEDGGCFEVALAAVRRFGGVLEHPAHSLAFRRFGLPIPNVCGWTASLLDEGWSCEVDQAHYGHPTNKRTWLYCVGFHPLPLRWGPALFTGRTVRNDGGGGRDQRSRTPVAFRDELLNLARHVRSQEAA